MQVSWIQVTTARPPVANVFTAVLGTPFTQTGAVLLGSPVEKLPVRERVVPVSAVFQAAPLTERIVPVTAVFYYAPFPYVPSPPPFEGGVIGRPGPVERPKPVPIPAPRVRGTIAVLALKARAQARGKIVAPAYAYGRIRALKALLLGHGQSLPLPVVELVGRVAALLPSGSGVARVLQPHHGRGRAGSYGLGVIRGQIVDAALATGRGHAPTAATRATGRVRWPAAFELEELWLVGVGTMETDEELLLV